MLEWLTLWPTKADLPVSSQRRDIETIPEYLRAGRAGQSRSSLRRLRFV
jgi:hypothetical protein